FPTQPGPLPPPTARTPKQPSLVPDELAQYRASLEEIKAKQQDFTDATREAVAAHTKSWATGSQEVKAYIEAEKKEVNSLIDSTTALVNQKAPNTPAGKEQAKTTADRLKADRTRVLRELDHVSAEADRSAASEDQAILRERARARLAQI